jgi:hypothetical protein
VRGGGRSCIGNLEKGEIALARIQTPDDPARSVVTTPTRLLFFPGATQPIEGVYFTALYRAL